MAILLPILIQVIATILVGLRFKDFLPNVLLSWIATTAAYYAFLLIFNKDAFDLIAAVTDLPVR